MPGKKHIRIRTQLIAILVVPITGLVWFATAGVTTRTHSVGELTELQSLAGLAVDISNLVHETQKERGATSGFLGGGGADFKTRLSAQRLVTDERAKTLRGTLVDFDLATADAALRTTLSQALTSLGKIQEIRSRVDTFAITTDEALAFYTSMNSSFLDAITSMVTVSSNGEIVSMTAAYVNFLMGKERMGLERAVLSNTFAADKFRPGMYQRFIELVTAQNTYTDIFIHLAPASQQDFYHATLNTAASRDVAAMEQIALDHATTGGFGVGATTWFDTMTDKINQMKTVEDRLSQDLVDRSTEIARRARSELMLFAVTALVIVLLTLAIAILFVRGILRKLGGEPHQMEEIAARLSAGDLGIETGHSSSAHGVYGSLVKLVESLGRKATVLEQIAGRNLDVTIELDSDRDGLGESLRSMRDALNEVLGEVNETVDRVTSGADQVAQAGVHLSDGATEQASSVEEIAASVHEISARSRTTTESAVEANTLAKEAAASASDGDGEMARLRDAMHSISSSSDEIQKIVKVIDDIAFQINLLALNANVEAARAGKYGRGFAVVADEVRGLAGRSAQAVRETRTMVDRAAASIADGRRLTDITSERFAGILKGTSRVAAVLAEIAEASKAELLAIDEITSGLDQVDEVTQSNTASAEESAAAAQELSDQARSLQTLVSRFTLVGQSTTGATFHDEDGSDARGEIGAPDPMIALPRD